MRKKGTYFDDMIVSSENEKWAIGVKASGFFYAMNWGETVSEKERNIEYRGRIKIYTDVKKITSNNVIDVLSRAMIKHEQNRTQIRYLINFEKGDQPLMREKKERKDIDIK